MLTADQQQLAVLFVGDTTDPPGLLAANVAAIALRYDGRDMSLLGVLQPGASLEFLYTQRDLVQIALGTCRELVDSRTEDQAESLSQRAKALQAMLSTLGTQIAALEALVRANARVAVGQLATTKPVSPPCGGTLDATDPRYAGSPYYPTTRRTAW